jgi:excisionase family DNA binding protein
MDAQQIPLLDSTPEEIDQRTHLTLEETAARLGIGYSTLRRWIAQKRLPDSLFLRAPRLIRFRREALEAYLADKEFVNGTLPTPPKPRNP